MLYDKINCVKVSSSIVSVMFCCSKIYVPTPMLKINPSCIPFEYDIPYPTLKAKKIAKRIPSHRQYLFSIQIKFIPRLAPTPTITMYINFSRYLSFTSMIVILSENFIFSFKVFAARLFLALFSQALVR